MSKGRGGGLEFIFYFKNTNYYHFRCGGNIWFALELCSGGPASELARQLVRRGRRLIDEQIAYIIKEVLHALIYLQVIYKLALSLYK